MNYYDKINWKNRSEGKTTKISAERLNHMDNQIFNNANAIGNVEKIADIGDGTLCGAAETLKETAEKLIQSLNKKQDLITFKKIPFINQTPNTVVVDNCYLVGNVLHVNLVFNSANSLSVTLGKFDGISANGRSYLEGYISNTKTTETRIIYIEDTSSIIALAEYTLPAGYAMVVTGTIIVRR